MIMGLNLNESVRQELADNVLGIRVDKAAISCAGATTKSIFNVVGGNCVIFGLVAESTGAVTAGANNAKFTLNPTAAGTTTDLCATADIASEELGGLMYITGSFASAMVALAAGAGAAVMMTTPILVVPGVLGFATDADKDNTNKFSVWYAPADDGAYIEAA
jgi:hypothetical protein